MKRVSRSTAGLLAALAFVLGGVLVYFNFYAIDDLLYRTLSGQQPDAIEMPPTIEEPAIIEGGTDFTAQRVFFGTDRKVASDTEIGPVFGYDRAAALTLGYTDITIPTNAHKVGRIELPRNITVFSVTLYQEAEDPARHFTVHETAILEPDAFRAMAAEAAANAEAYADTALVFIHGFNTTFRAASFRTAQLAYDLQFDGPTFLYSWPSVGATQDYGADMDSAENAAPHIDAFLDEVFRVEGVQKVHLIAHSMGNEALAELFKRAGTKLEQRTDKPIDQLILAAPDLDADQFRSIADRFTRFAKGVTLYAASTDLALLASKSLRKNYIRLGDVGDEGPTVVAGVDTIDVSAVGTEVFSLNHNIYARNRGVLDDLGRLLKTGERPPSARMPTVRERQNSHGTYWQMPD
ncbi:alpha/beta hydrolase [Sulfitobacter sp. S190]|uniref:alpha/beta hydrolase n=1 Tax=Sulfitobacter sp. S190 TaxID=2867022 RepID=UPI0021A76CF6|nr:alpha/beta fold hydrolase [Sulfitobacter sp. S190]UWR22811.1 alpha/beta fold hydrolase [Sulfitobacter sp. S190]